MFLVEHRTTGRRVVAKLIHAKLAADPALMERLRIEAQAVAQLEHEHIVKILAFEQTRTGRPFLVMEYLEGRTLAEEIAARGALPVFEAVTYAVQLLSALSLVHDKGLVHRDIKPDNLFVCVRRDGSRSLKLLDFGVVRVMPGSEHIEPLPYDYRTRTGVVVGTPRFVSPEGAMGQPVDPRGDLYAAGLTLYIMLTGRGPFDHLDGEQLLLTAHATEDPAPPSRLSQAPVPAELDRALLKALAKNPNERFQTAEEFRAYLDQVEASLRRPVGFLETTAFSADGSAQVQSAAPPTAQAPAAPPQAASVLPSSTVRIDPAPVATEPVAPVYSDAVSPAGRDRPQLRLSPAAAAVVFVVALVIAGLAALGLVTLLRGSP